MDVSAARRGLKGSKLSENPMDVKVNLGTEAVADVFDFFYGVNRHHVIPATGLVCKSSEGHTPTRGKCRQSSVAHVD